MGFSKIGTDTLTGHVIVVGTDKLGDTGKAFLDSSLFDQVKDIIVEHEAKDALTKDVTSGFKKANAWFYEAHAKYKEATAGLEKPATDRFKHVLSEGVKAVEGKAEESIDLIELYRTADTAERKEQAYHAIILSVIEQGTADDELIWNSTKSELIWLGESSDGVAVQVDTDEDEVGPGNPVDTTDQ